MTLQHPERLLSDVLDTRTGARRTPLGPLVTAGPQGAAASGGPATADSIPVWSGDTESRLVPHLAVHPSAGRPRTGERAVRAAAGRAARTLSSRDVPAADAAVVPLASAGDGDLVLADAPRADVEVSAAEIIAAIAEGRVPRGRHRVARPVRERSVSGPGRMRRPTLYLAAALVGATGVGLVTAGGDPAAQADTETATQATSVADALGLQAAPASPAAVETQAVDQLQQMVASRAQRETEQVAAADAQAAADQAALDAQAAAEAAAIEAARPRAVAPVDGARLSSTFGYRWGTLHAGIDLAAPMLTPEYAVMDGVVLKAGAASGFGQAVYIQHENGDVTVYGHMEQILVTAGQVVQAGDTIALLGNQGQSTGPHLHLEVHLGGIDGEKVDPVPWLAERGVTL